MLLALSDPTRQRILLALSSRGELNVGGLVELQELAQPTISRHLAVLYDAEIVDRERRGQRVVYFLAADGLLIAQDFLRSLAG